jgi:hypothetical protein
MRQRGQVEASISRVEATPDSASQAMDVDSEIGKVECDEMQASGESTLISRSMATSRVLFEEFVIAYRSRII